MSSRRNLVTVVMPCRNISPMFFGEAVKSVLSQTSSRWRLLIVVDGDDPATRSIVAASLAEILGPGRDRRLEVLENEGAMITGAFNTGMRHARTPFVAVLHSDDLLDRSAVEVLSRYIERRREIDYFHSSRIYIDEDGRPISHLIQAVSSFCLGEFRSYGPVKSVHCWRVDSAVRIGGMDESLGPHAADDYDFSWRMAEAGCSFMAIPECLYYYRDHRAHYRLTTHVPLDRQIQELRKIFRAHGMNDGEMEEQIRRRRADYLRQALFLDDADKREKERSGFDIRQGWRQSLPAPA
jgi:glycosyltransferase involved in cell wall biosynthesis